MKITLDETKYLEIAIQTVLFNYKNQLNDLVENCDIDLLKRMSSDITRKAVTFRNITNETIKELERA